MPVITVALRTGRTIEQERALVEGLTSVFVGTCGGEPGGVWIELKTAIARRNFAEQPGRVPPDASVGSSE